MENTTPAPWRVIGYLSYFAIESTSVESLFWGGKREQTVCVFVRVLFLRFDVLTRRSYGSLAVALFWAFTNASIELEEAKSAYGLIVAFAQLGAEKTA